MIDSNVAIFRTLDEYCASRSNPLANAGRARWIATEPPDRKILQHSRIVDRLSFTPRKGVVRIDHERDCYFCTLGFDHIEPAASLVEVDLSAGLLTTILAELKVQPKASAAEIRDIVEVADKSTALYAGHDPQYIQTLYPTIDVFTSQDVALEETWRVFFLLCLAECRRGETWIDATLADALEMLAELSLVNVPYQTLCRSIFDSDPAAMFLALYRCLEAIYAYSSAKAIIDALDLKNDWAEIAATLESTIGWHPREENSLTALFSLGDNRDHNDIFIALNETAPSGQDGPVSGAAARRVYKLRNDLVHFRPAQARIDHSAIRWNFLCGTIVTLICYIYSTVFEI